MFKLGWFVNGFAPKTWHGPWAGENRTEWMGPGFWQDVARGLERGGFDMFFLEDTAMIEDTYEGSAAYTLRHAAMAPKNDPMPLMPLLAAATKHIGLVSTISTIQYPPYLAARLGTTLDHLTEGRIGFNVVTSVSHRVAQNYGYERHLEHDERYVMAEEWMDAVSQLWESWEPDALVLETDPPFFADHTKVKAVDFEGKYFRTRGPLNTVPGPQRRPVIAQAGGSPKGRDLAARNADVMLGLVQSPEEMVEFRADMDRRLAAFGRDPDDLHIFFMAHAYIGESDRDGRERFDAVAASRHDPSAIAAKLWAMSYTSGGEIDFSKFDLDGPVPTRLGNGETTTHKAWTAAGAGKTLRDVVTGPANYGLDFVGSAATIASQMDEVMRATGRMDGFLIQGIEDELTRRSLAEVTDGLCPELKRRGLIRKSYEHDTFRENLESW
ncbi:NtaA/DmoA family FMN-dependent monooxygenase [Frondihabitans australicus]|uniref:FMN-dependent oxidoreductase (Nitrilotriacetate monooxygenase family) n=1 Tax=Frondihabitans australicus TaxID=386892 RepID=A0A495IDN6_9MICO|nr:NtaA/DmoA family FMN-dependent monooxygenase [Frondihabitans australicus]RKR73431.1 FMN-dependent oxidoreductase (nitrilotriacetate monooxygenase family) [Frondihabitans australicus]